jgi:hypothetical protein
MSRKRKPATASMFGNFRTLYYAPDKLSGFASLLKLASESPRGTKRADTQRWLLQQDSNSLHRPLRKRFLRNPYTVTNIMDVLECDLIDIQNVSKYNDNYRNLLSVIDVFSKFLHIVPLRIKIGTAVASVFRSILAKYSHRRLIWVRRDRGKKFLTDRSKTCWRRRAFSFKCVAILKLNALSSNEAILPYETSCTNIWRIRTRTDTLMYCRNSRGTTIQFTARLVWPPRS